MIEEMKSEQEQAEFENNQRKRKREIVFGAYPSTPLSDVTNGDS